MALGSDLGVGQHKARHGDDNENSDGAHGGGDNQRAPDGAHQPEHAHCHLVYQEHDAPEGEEPAWTTPVSHVIAVWALSHAVNSIRTMSSQIAQHYLENARF